MAYQDPLWPRAAAWLGTASSDPALRVVGVPCAVASITNSDGHLTPDAVRRALAGFSTFDGEWGVDFAGLPVQDCGNWDVAELGVEESQTRIFELAAQLRPGPVHVFLGGDNAITRPLVKGLASQLDTVGVLTFDAHHDVRVLDGGPSNGTPIRGLIEDGLPGSHVVQIGIHSFVNSVEYRRYCAAEGVRVVTMDTVDGEGIASVTAAALADLAGACGEIYVDFDIDVLDKAYAPGCPGARPGGMAPRQLLTAARMCGAHPAVTACDLVEVDPSRDRDGITVETTAAVMLAFIAGVQRRFEPNRGVCDER